MQQIDFHFNVSNRLLYACRTASTVYRRGLTLAVWSSDRQRLNRFNDMLWEHDTLSFIPHVPANHPLAHETPIRFGTALSELTGDVLLLLDDYLPPQWEEEFKRFNRIIDVVSTDEKERQLSRARYRAYKAQGVTLEAYDRSL